MKKFGVVPRVGYNSDSFYARAIYADRNIIKNELPTEHQIPDEAINTIFCQDSRRDASASGL